MINIYCLVDPNTYLYKQSEKMKFISDIMAAGFKPRIRLLFVATLHNVDYYERFFYNLLTSHGYELLQLKHAFDYAKKEKSFQAKLKQYQQLRKYMQLRYKNILIIIW